MLHLYHHASENCSKAVTKRYSTSFSSAIRLLHKDLRAPIFNIYGFVRLADEIVDTFHGHDKSLLLENFKKDTFDAISRGLSLNPILHSFQMTVNEFGIDLRLIEAFFRSMEMDLVKKEYDHPEYREYIYGSAEVVGLMCLKVFCGGKQEPTEELTASARALGAAFQKVNFLRDMKADQEDLSRLYFPGCDFKNFRVEDKKKIEEDIQHDFKAALRGLKKLPLKARFGVYVAYKYYYSLFQKIRGLHPARILVQRIRIPNYHKALIIFKAGIRNQLRIL